MNYKQAGKIILLAVVLSFLLNIFFGRLITAKVSTWSVLNKIKLLDPQTPIVINTREEIRVNDGKDILEAIQNTKTKLSNVVFVQNGQVVSAGVALNLSSEGYFVAHAQTFAQKASEYFVVLSDGKKAVVGNRTVDPATNLVFFNAKLSNLPVMNWGDSRDLKVGEKLILIKNSLQVSVPRSEVVFVKISEKDVEGQTFEADRPSSGFVASMNESTDGSLAVVNTKGEVVGLTDGKGVIISSTVMKRATAKYFENKEKIMRSTYGFSYSILTKTESEILGLPQGAIIKNIIRTGKQKMPAFEAGLLEKDIIIAVEGQAISENFGLEDALQKYNPRDRMKITVIRGKESKELILNLGELR